MKSLFFSSIAMVTLLGVAITAYAQVPQGFNYQAVVRDVNGEIMINESVDLRFTIHDSLVTGNIIYQETESTSTNQYGLVNHVVGSGTVVISDFSSINWGQNAKYLQTELSTGSGYETIGSERLQSTPYALYAGTADYAKTADFASTAGDVDDADADPLNEIQSLSISGSELSISSGNTISLPNSIQSLSLDGNDLSISNGNTVVLPENNQSLSLNGNNLSISGGNTVSLPSSNQSLSLNGNNLSISGGNTVSLPSQTAYWFANGNGNGINNGNSGHVEMCTNPNNSLGNIGIGNIANSNVKAFVGSNQDYGMFIEAPQSTWAFFVQGTAGKTGGSSWVVASDKRLKRDVTKYSDGLETLKKINPVWFRYTNESGMNSQKQYVGVIAQELREVAPYMVGSERIRPDSEEEYLNVDNTAITYMLINAVKEQQAMIEKMQAEIDELKAE